MKVNYVLMYGTPYLKYREFETFEDISKFLVKKSIVNYSIFKKLEDKEEVEMIYRDNDIHYLEIEEQVKHDMRLKKEIEDLNNRIDKAIEYIKSSIKDSKPNLYDDDLDDLYILLNILKGGNNDK